MFYNNNSYTYPSLYKEGMEYNNAVYKYTNAIVGFANKRNLVTIPFLGFPHAINQFDIELLFICFFVHPKTKMVHINYVDSTKKLKKPSYTTPLNEFILCTCLKELNILCNPDEAEALIAALQEVMLCALKFDIYKTYNDNSYYRNSNGILALLSHLPSNAISLIDNNVYCKCDLSIARNGKDLLLHDGIWITDHLLDTYEKNIDKSIRKRIYRQYYQDLKANRSLKNPTPSFQIKYNNVILNYISTVFSIRERWVKQNVGYKVIPYEWIKEVPSGCSSNLCELLYMLSNRDPDITNEIAKLAASCFLDSGICRQIIAVYCPDKTTLLAFSAFMDIMLLGRWTTFKTLANKTLLSDMLQWKADGISAVFLNDDFLSNWSVKDKQFLQKIISCKKLKMKDNYFKDGYYKNNMQYILFTTEQSKINLLSRMCNTKQICIGTFTSSTIKLEEADIDWLFGCFLPYGLLLLADKESPKENITYSKSKNILDEFVSDCCTIAKGSEVTASKLFEAYSTFVVGKYGAAELKRTHMVKELLERYEELDYCRPHHSRSQSNAYCFKGISIDPQKMEELMRSIADRPAPDAISKETFSAYLSNIVVLLKDAGL